MMLFFDFADSEILMKRDFFSFDFQDGLQRIDKATKSKGRFHVSCIEAQLIPASFQQRGMLRFASGGKPAIATD